MLAVGDPGVPLSLNVCILTCNRDELLRPLLMELKKQLRPADEVLVLDTGANPSTGQVVSDASSSQIHYHAYPMERFDFATARNELLRLSQRDGAVFIDDDALPFPDWLSHVRTNLLHVEATGGVTVADGAMPDWWDPALNWCVGLSPPGTVLGLPGFYPDTCNLGANQALWCEHPFSVVAREDRQLYATGREDAEWWLDRRLHGRRVATSYRQAVIHHIHPERLQYAYVKERARNDGVSSWLRRPAFDAATAIPWDFAHIVGIVANKTVRRPFDMRYRLADVVWMHRQWGKFCAVWNSPIELRPRRREQVKQLAKAAAFQVRIRLGEAGFKGLNAFRHRGAFPVTDPKTIFVSADCHVGDSVILRRHIQAVAITFPHADVVVSCRHPVLLQGLEPNVQCDTTNKVSEKTRSGLITPDVAIVPYFPFGDDQLWRDKLSKIGATFNCDVSFSGRRDYLYARKLVKKNLELHEHENLARLFRLWPLRSVASVPPPPVPNAAMQWVEEQKQLLGISGDYVLVQFGAGQDFKEWPLDCWIPFLQEFGERVQFPILITGGDNWRQAAEIAVREVKHGPGLFSMITDTTLTQMMALVKKASYLVGGCSGPKHLAIAYQVPTFTLYAATEPERWGASEGHHLHGYVNALPQKLTGMDLQGLDKHHRVRLLQPGAVAAAAAEHFASVMRRE